MSEETEQNETVDAPVIFSAEQEDRLNQIVNNAVAGVRKGLTKTLETSISQLVAQKKNEEAPKSDEQDPKDLRIAELERKMQKAAEDRDRSRKTTARAQLESQLQKAGVRPELLGPLADSMTLRGALSVPEDGDPVLMLNEEPYSISDGVKEWLKSSEAKAFLPAKEAKPTGGHSGLRPQSNWTSGDDLQSIARKHLQ